MKKIFLGLFLLASSQAFSAQSEEFKQCMETCMAFEGPGYALKACVYKCVTEEEDREEAPKNKMFCETYEDCDDLF